MPILEVCPPTERRKDESVSTTEKSTAGGGIHSTLVSNASCVCDLGYIIIFLPSSFFFPMCPCMLNFCFLSVVLIVFQSNMTSCTDSSLQAIIQKAEHESCTVCQLLSAVADVLRSVYSLSKLSEDNRFLRHSVRNPEVVLVFVTNQFLRMVYNLRNVSPRRITSLQASSSLIS